MTNKINNFVNFGLLIVTTVLVYVLIEVSNNVNELNTMIHDMAKFASVHNMDKQNAAEEDESIKLINAR